jgi:4-diphosphocytidyl-2-C-methyl-D-erythritol kinase
MLTLFSPAKVNLFFKVHYLREDHYHQISSLFQAINLLDIISFSLADQDRFQCNIAQLAKREENLIWQAVALFRQKTQWGQKLSISLQKNIPIQAGLGGGSSNAATTLWALNQLCGQKIAESTLAIWASELGSDMAFFFSEGTAFCQGRGEIVQHVEQLVHTRFWLAKPQFSLSTPLVYQKCNVEQLSQWDSLQALSDACEGKISLRNDLEHAAFALNPRLQVIKQGLLERGFLQVSMTGSGTAFICFGNIEAPEFPGVIFYPVQFLQRKRGSWY